MGISLFNFLWLWFSFYKRLVEASWWERLTVGESGFCSDGWGHGSVNLESNLLLMGGAVFPPCCLPWGQTMVGVMAVMVASFKRTYACTTAFSAPDPATGHSWPTPPVGTPRHSSGHKTGKCQFSFQSQRKAMPKSIQTMVQLYSSHMLAK